MGVRDPVSTAHLLSASNSRKIRAMSFQRTVETHVNTTSCARSFTEFGCMLLDELEASDALLLQTFSYAKNQSEKRI